MNLLITGDFYISDDFRGKDLFDSSIIALFNHADYRIVNLEAPVTIKNKQNRILKTGPHLHTTQETTVPALKRLNIDLVTLANNHIMDYGQPGLLDTLTSLKSAKIGTVGASLNLLQATKPFVLEKDGVRIAILNFAENEWASASHDKAGANPLDVIENLKQIHEATKISEFIIVIIHGGHEYFHFPSPLMVKRYRFYAECGASVIVGHHPHCISGCEVYKGVPIFYSLGNFVFTIPSRFEAWYTGTILDLHLKRDKEISWDLIPVSQSKSNHAVTRLEGEEKEIIRSEVDKYSKIIADKALLSQRWKTFLSDRKKDYLNIFNPINFIQNQYIKYGITKLGLDRFFIRKKHYAQILNHLRCEALAEASKDVIGHFLE